MQLEHHGDEVTHTFECNHEEADTRVVLHAALSSEDVVLPPIQIFWF